MKIKTYVITIAISLIFTGLILAIEISKTSSKNIKQIEETCEHEWVITSEFTLFSKTHYRTVSKCTKCGKVIR